MPPENNEWCQTIIPGTPCLHALLHALLKESQNNPQEIFWKSLSHHTNIQYDVFKSTKEFLKDFLSNQEDKLHHHLTSQGFFFTNVIKHSLPSVNSIWAVSLTREYFTIRYINSSLPTWKNITRWGLSQSRYCSFFQSHSSIMSLVVNIYLDHFTWRYDSILNFIANS